ncbi:coproporphyrinogen III oxidase [Aliigemmobacter aestuarii]|uniref:Heme chaperone HemW n=1 Tax=Aliigemmobacter aestuarii TaxID=1445661 RepID=A0A4S3MSU6_9RHOB|nr:radical SAM family heme chaperone HemW [Gemmobacter aestuarii]THD85660.1 coproporphyrinogen III oxidase [Gemmobacter aestuarii]
MEDWRHGGFGLYLHWPFCQSKCPYCDFNSHVAARIDQGNWQNAYLQEIDRIGGETGNRVLNTVYFGGGTPSLMEGRVVGAILERIGKTWTLANDIEITLEANPGSVEAARFADYRAAGVNRVSLGVQSLRDADLRRLGRLHDAAAARDALEIAKRTFDRVSFDLIYARQDQTLSDWEAELGEALQLAAGHLSLYQLTIESGTAFGDRLAAGKLRGLPDEDLSVDFFELTQSMTEAAGIPAYEVSNHAEPGNESRHNLIYWRSGDFAGIGPGAHGRLTLNGRRIATETARNPNAWLSTVMAGRSGDSLRETLDQSQILEEFLVMGLRTSEGLDVARLSSLCGKKDFSSDFKDLEDFGLISTTPHKLMATAKGRLVLNRLIEEIATRLE